MPAMFLGYHFSNSSDNNWSLLLDRHLLFVLVVLLVDEIFSDECTERSIHLHLLPVFAFIFIFPQKNTI